MSTDTADATNTAAPPPASFDLTSHPWILVQRLDGEEVELSLTEVFEQAPDIRRLVGDVPTQDFALLRLLLAILHDVVEGPRDVDEWEELREGGIPADRVRAYLDEHRDRFDLLHPTTPFFQVADLRTKKGDVSSLDRIVADVPNGSRFFTMRASGAERLSFAEAARWVAHAHAYDTSGIKSGAVGDPREKNGKVYPQGVGWSGNLGGVYVEGDDLHQTLLLNLIASDEKSFHLRTGTEKDAPAWRRPQNTAEPLAGVEAEVRPHGLRDLYTWQSRRIRLHHDGEGVHGVLLGYGDPLTARNKHDREPMTAWRRSPNQEKALREAQVYLPREHDPSRSSWRGLGALVTGYDRYGEQRQEAAKFVRPRILDWISRLTHLEGVLEKDFLIRARLVGAVYGTQQSVIDEIVDDAVAMPIVLFHDRESELTQTAIDAVTDAEEAVTVLGDLATALADAAGADGEGPRAGARDRGFAELDEPFRKWLRGLNTTEPPLEQRREWQLEAHLIVSRLGDELMDTAGEAAWTGRVISTKKGSIWLTASRADLRFRAALRKALPLTNIEDSPEEKQ